MHDHFPSITQRFAPRKVVMILDCGGFLQPDRFGHAPMDHGVIGSGKPGPWTTKLVAEYHALTKVSGEPIYD